MHKCSNVTFNDIKARIELLFEYFLKPLAYLSLIQWFDAIIARQFSSVKAPGNWSDPHYLGFGFLSLSRFDAL